MKQHILFIRYYLLCTGGYVIDSSSSYCIVDVYNRHIQFILYHVHALEQWFPTCGPDTLSCDPWLHNIDKKKQSLDVKRLWSMVHYQMVHGCLMQLEKWSLDVNKIGELLHQRICNGHLQFVLHCGTTVGDCCSFSVCEKNLWLHLL